MAATRMTGKPSEDSVAPNVHDLIDRLPKAELHLHIEGTLEPELMFEIAARNDVSLPFESVEDVRAAYEFSDLQSFLDIYYEGARCLLHERDFFDLTWAYLERVRADNVVHAEIFFDPQTHTERGVAFETVLDGITGALDRAESELGITSELILCFLRHLDADSAMETLERALPHRDRIVGVGLDSSEVGNPPRKFTDVFERARAEGFVPVAHAGEEGPPAYIEEALDLLEVERIDHGVRCEEDPELVERLRNSQVPLTVCPLSNVKLRVFDTIADHNIGRLLDAGLCVTVNSDDPAYFGGYLNTNYRATADGLGLDEDAILQLVRNSFLAAFLDEDARSGYLDRVQAEAAAS